MKKLLVGLAAVPFLAGIAMAGQLTPLSDVQMDKVTAGAFTEVEWGNFVEITAHWCCGPITVEFGPDGAPSPMVINHPDDVLHNGGDLGLQPNGNGFLWGAS